MGAAVRNTGVSSTSFSSLISLGKLLNFLSLSILIHKAEAMTVPPIMVLTKTEGANAGKDLHPGAGTWGTSINHAGSLGDAGEITCVCCLARHRHPLSYSRAQMWLSWHIFFFFFSFNF